MHDDSNPPKPPTRRRQRQRVEAALIFTTPPSFQDIVYLARELILCTLPHSDPGDVPAWSRRNGNLTLTIRPGWDEKKREVYGYPYGIIPRLVLVWMVTEIVRTRSRRLELGNSLREFMAALGLNPCNGGTGAKRSDARRLREQMERLFRSIISFEYSAENQAKGGKAWLDMQVAPEGLFWWSKQDPDQEILFGSWIEVSERFYEAVMAFPVPLDVRVLRYVKDSSLGIDLYTVLNREAYRAHKDGKPRFLAWEWLMVQTGNEFSALRDFRKRALEQIEVILTVHSGLRISLQRGCRNRKSGLIVDALSTPSIPPDPARPAPPRNTAAPRPPLTLVPPPPPPPERHLHPRTVEQFKAMYPRLDPHACKADFDAWQEGLPDDSKARHYDRAFLGFARKWVVGKLIVSNP